jgi:hypothetical protein
LKIVFLHFGGRSNDPGYRRYLTAPDRLQTMTKVAAKLWNRVEHKTGHARIHAERGFLKWTMSANA